MKILRRLKSWALSERVEQGTVIAIILVIVCAVALAVFGCSGTIHPTPVNSSTASFSGTNHSSGIYGYIDHKLVVDQSALDRYYALIKRYGGYYLVPPKPGEGVTPMPDGRYLMDKQHAAYWFEMNSWWKNHREEKAP